MPFILGIVLLCVAQMTDIAFMRYDFIGPSGNVNKNVGYLYALNWSVVSVLLLPFSLAIIAINSTEFERILDQLLDENRIITKNFIALTDVQKNKLKNTISTATNTTFLIGFISSLTLASFDFNHSVVQIILNPSNAPHICPIPADNVEVDWSIGSVIDPQGISVYANIIFSLIAYAYVPGIGMGIVAGFFCALVGFFVGLRVHCIYNNYLLIPDVYSADRRRGMDLFSDLFIVAGILSILSFFSCYFLLTQNYFLRSCDETIFQFLTPHSIRDFQSGTSHGTSDWLRLILGDLLAIGPFNLKSTIAIFLVFLSKVMCLGLSYYVLYTTARQGANRLKSALVAQDPENVQALSFLVPGDDEHRQKILKNMENVTFWPIEQINIKFACLVTGLCFIIIVFYLCWPLPVTYLIFRSLRRAKSIIKHQISPK